MLPRALALSAVLVAALLPSALRRANLEQIREPCVPEGRGRPPRHWLGCRGDPGPPRDLTAEERLVLARPLDLNSAGERELAFVPGLSARLARAVVEHRRAHGPFRSVEELRAVRGIGPGRLAQARGHLEVDERPPDPLPGWPAAGGTPPR